MQGNTAQIRSINTELLRRILRDNPGSSKAELAEKSGLSYPTCSTIVNALAESGEAIAEQSKLEGGGRPTVLYRYNKNFGSLVCVALQQQGQKTLAGLTAYNLLGGVVAEETIEYANFAPVHLKEMVASVLPALAPLRCICVGIPGVVLHGQTIPLCDIPSLENGALAEELEQAFGVPVVLENDMNLVVLGFAHGQQAGAEFPVAALAFPQANFPGAGVFAGGRIVRGFSNFAGEVSFLPFGYSRGTPQERLEQGENLLPLVCNTLLAFICILNPSKVLLTGRLLLPGMLPEIERFCKCSLPQEHLPHLILEPDYLPYYQQGLLALALEKNSYPLQIVQKQI